MTLQWKTIETHCQYGNLDGMYLAIGVVHINHYRILSLSVNMVKLNISIYSRSLQDMDEFTNTSAVLTFTHFAVIIANPNVLFQNG